ncbi:E3 ubiquitin-protein ligase MIB2-like [Daphnia pulex]|uniref:E3 ubiquitin-protein ligase MIB2-like n=1 Tax=Daphnia pulex TaxID=6669 RepID=UPI001EE0CEB3|nr:E3 ubiquitin-protein ligase MIB2-like [Daphnia pulex]
MGSIGYTKDELVGLRVVRGPNWEWDTQDGGEGFVGTVVENIQNSGRVKVRWDSGQEFIYRIGAEDAYDLRVLDSSTVGVKHPGVECRGCGQKDIAGLSWQCFDCPMPINLCTFCFTNRKREQTHVIFQRYDRPLSDPMVVRLHPDQPRIPLKGIFPGALVRRGADWKYGDEDGWKDKEANPPIGKVVPTPTGREMTSGKIWVQWPCELDKSYPYRVGFSGKMDLKMAKAGVGGQYQPDTLPVLKISKPRVNEKTNEVVADPPLVVGDRVKVVVGLEDLREMSVDCGIGWNAGKMKKVANEILIIKDIDNKENTAKAIRRLTPWLPVGAVVQVIDKPSNGMVMVQDVMAGVFGRVKRVNFDGKTVDMEFFTSGGNVIKTVDVDQLENKLVDVSVVEKVDSIRKSIRKELAKLLLSEVEKGSILSVQFLLKTYPDIINCQSRYNGRNSTALSVACQKGNVEMVKLLLTHKASVDIADEEGKEKVEKGCEYCGEPDDDSDDDSDDDVESHKKGMPIHHAAIRNHPEVLRLLLGNGASSNEINGKERTPLHLAAMKGYVECVRVLLEDERCDLAIKDRYDDTAFELAVESSVQSVELFNLFRATGRLIIIEKDHWGKNLLHLAAEYKNFEAAKLLLSCPEGKKLACECDYYDKTPLFIACDEGHNQIAKLLVSNVDKDENGKPWGIDTPNYQGKTPLMRVVEKFNYELIEHLIGAGANLHATDKKGDAPFHYAARLYREKKRPLEWPNQETSPEIFKLYNELNTKHPGENLSPHAAVICYLVAKGGCPQNITFPEFKKLVGDDFLHGDEIINFFPDQLNSMSQNVGNQLQYSQPAGWSERNVRNAHEEHLPSKRGRQSTVTESDVPSTSNKRKKKT